MCTKAGSSMVGHHADSHGFPRGSSQKLLLYNDLLSLLHPPLAPVLPPPPPPPATVTLVRTPPAVLLRWWRRVTWGSSRRRWRHRPANTWWTSCGEGGEGEGRGGREGQRTGVGGCGGTILGVGGGGPGRWEGVGGGGRGHPVALEGCGGVVTPAWPMHTHCTQQQCGSPTALP